MGGGEEEGSLGHLCSCSFVSLKYHHPTYLLGKHLLVLQPFPTLETFLSPLTARQKCSPLCIPILPLRTLSPALTTRDHAYLLIMPMIAYCQPGTVLGSLHVPSRLILTTASYSQHRFSLCSLGNSGTSKSGNFPSENGSAGKGGAGVHAQEIWSCPDF